jgi:HlyD family secretion protein
MSARNRFLVLLSVIFIGAFIYYLLTTNRTRGLELIGTVDANQVVVSARIQGRIDKLLVEEGTPVKQGQVIAVLDPAELRAAEQAATATIGSLRSKVSEMRATEQATTGSVHSDVVNAQARVQSARSQLAQAQADLVRVKSDTARTVALAQQGVASQQDKDRAEALLQAQVAAVESLKEQVSAAQAELSSAVARTHQAHAAQSTVAASRADLASAEAQRAQAQVRLGYTNIVAPVSGTVSVRAAREGEVVSPGQAIVTIVDLNDTWVLASVPETYADHVALGDVFQVRMPSGQSVPGKVFYKAVEGDFATQRDVSRRKRDIKTVALKLRIANPDELFVPGMTADVVVPPSVLQRELPARTSGQPAHYRPSDSGATAAEERPR